MQTAIVSLLLIVPSALACPWCNNTELQKPTVLPGTPDLGGKFFGAPPDSARTRQYFIAAEPVTWNYLPKGVDPVGKSRIPDYIRSAPTAQKLRYVQYTDVSFSIRANHPAHLGILGPVLRGLTGEFLSVTFLNRTERPLSIHPHGVKYDKDNEGASYFPDRGRGAAIAPQARFTYVWHIDDLAGPSPSEPSSKAWLYHSHVLADQEINLGLFGFIVVTDPARARSDGTPADVDRELATAFTVFDETFREDEDLYSLPLPANPDQRRNFIFHRTAESVREMEMAERMARHSVNGLIFGNLDGLEMVQGERVRWYLFALGSEKDLHTAHWHGARVIARALRTDVVELLPGSMVTSDLLADNPGSWLFHCHVADHMMEGMYAPFKIHPAGHFLARSPSRFYPSSGSPPGLLFHAAEARLEGTNIVHLSVAGRIGANAMPPPNLPVEITLGAWKTSFTMPPDGNGVSSNVTFHLGFESRVGANSLDFSAVATDLAIPFVSTSSIPVRLRLGPSEITGHLHLVPSTTNASRLVVPTE